MIVASSAPSGLWLPGRWLVLARAAWIALVLLTLGMFAAGVPLLLRQLQTVCPPAPCISFQLHPLEASALAGLGLSLRFYAWYVLTLGLFSLAAFLVTAGVIFWRPSPSRMTVLLSFALVTLVPAFFNPMMEVLVQGRQGWYWPVTVLQALGVWFSLVTIYLFPEGRFVTRWPRLLMATITAYGLLLVVYTSLTAVLNRVTLADRLLQLVLWGFLLAGANTQVYRYRHLSGPVERQQTKWVIFGWMVLVSELIGFQLVGRVVPALRQVGLPSALFTFVGGTLNIASLLFALLCLAVAILRYRLWDIDVIIRRTLVFSVLTTALALAYFASIVLLQMLFQLLTGQGQAELVTVLSTLVIAALFAPLRGRIQAGIERRFYRRKYDADLALRLFSAAARDDVDLDRLRDNLLAVVQATMQPAHASLMLRGETKQEGGRAAGPVGSAEPLHVLELDRRRREQ